MSPLPIPNSSSRTRTGTDPVVTREPHRGAGAVAFIPPNLRHSSPFQFQLTESTMLQMYVRQATESVLGIMSGNDWIRGRDLPDRPSAESFFGNLTGNAGDDFLLEEDSGSDDSWTDSDSDSDSSE